MTLFGRFASERLVVGGGEGDVSGGAAPANAEIADGMESEGALCCARRGDREEVGAFDVLKIKGGAGVESGVGNFDVGHFEIANVAEEEAGGGRRSESAGVRIVIFFLFGRNSARHIRGAAAESLDIDVRQLEVFNHVIGKTS